VVVDCGKLFTPARGRAECACETGTFSSAPPVRGQAVPGQRAMPTRSGLCSDRCRTRRVEAPETLQDLLAAVRAARFSVCSPTREWVERWVAIEANSANETAARSRERARADGRQLLWGTCVCDGRRENQRSLGADLWTGRLHCWSTRDSAAASFAARVRAQRRCARARFKGCRSHVGAWWHEALHQHAVASFSRYRVTNRKGSMGKCGARALRVCELAQSGVHH